MTRWTKLHTIPNVGLDKQTAGQAAELNERIATLETERQAADKMRADFLAADPADAAEPGLHFTGYREVLDAARMQCLAHELSLRQDLAVFLDGPRREAMTAAAEQADAAHEQAREQIERGLLALGYDSRDAWLNGMVERHPQVHAAREAARSARAHSSDQNMIVANKAARDQVRAEIDQRRAAAVA
jgi:hypothetical protein